MKIILSVLFILISANSFAATDVHNTKLEFVYQVDSLSTSFEFSTGDIHGCGSTVYKVESRNDVVADRMFAITLLAFEMDASFSFHDTEVCEGNRSLVKWVRIVK
ncbi:MAG: hypothetical protein HRT53_18190 [Colwellia sp.]|nr:hypothetical protein [Colwellia sp.]